jgi:DNA-binding XRE family transcriptional regulator
MGEFHAHFAPNGSHLHTFSLTSGPSWTEIVGNRLRDLREAACLTQTQLARQAGIYQSQISRQENGESPLTERSLKRIAKVLCVRPEQIDPSFRPAGCRKVS